MVKKIGWLQQQLDITGGAEMSTGALIKHAPDWAEIVYCPPNKRPNTEELDCFVIQNSTNYSSSWIEELSMKPVIRHVRDPWLAGSALLRRWLLQNSKLMIFSSPTQYKHLGYEVKVPYKFIPPPVPLDDFKAHSKPEEERRGTVCVGRFDVYKGAMYIIDWALASKEPLTVVGNNNYMNFGRLPSGINFVGEVGYKFMPEILGSHKNYIAMPMWVEAFGRSVVEAWAAGCNLILGGRIGAQWWIENEPERLGYMNPIKEFWEAVEEVLGGS